MRLPLAIAATMLACTLALASEWPPAESYMNAEFVCANHPQPRNCEFGMASFPADYRKAIQGDYLAQKNVAYCFESGCYTAVKRNAQLACAWNIVIMGFGHLQLEEIDRRYAEQACRKLDATDRKTAERQANRMLKLLGVE